MSAYQDNAAAKFCDYVPEFHSIAERIADAEERQAKAQEAIALALCALAENPQGKGGRGHILVEQAMGLIGKSGDDK